MTQTKKVLAILLAVLMLALSMPFAAFAEGDTWTMTPLIENPNGKTEANEIVFQDEDGFVLNWYPKDESIERFDDGWWVGVKFTAPSADIAETAQYAINGGEKADFVDESQTGDNWMGLWILINEAKVKTALQGDGLIKFTVVFYNDAEDAEGQTFVVSLDASSLILKKNDAVVLQTVPEKEATETAHGNIAYYISYVGEEVTYYKLDEDGEPVAITLADTVTHNPSAEWTTDGTKHWKVCTVCETVVEEAGHTPSTAWETDGTKHWKVCTVCEAVVEEANHTPSPAWSTDSAQHWKLCTICNGVIGEEENHSGGTATCTEQAVCESCGLPYGEALGHLINGNTINWVQNEGEAGGYTAYAFCTRCKETLEVEALFEADSTGSATCENPASGHYYVVISGTRYFKPETETNGSALGHEYQFDSFVWSADNTTAQAKLVCSRCSGEKLENATVTPVAHEATCTEDAYTVYTATYGTTDPETDSKTVTAQNTKLGHIYDNGVAVYNDDNATHNKICDRCREPSAPVACFSNANVGWSGNTATCTEPGKEYRTCPVCSHQYERDTTALGHNYGAVTHFDPDSNNYVKAQVPCSRCDGITERKPVELSETPATCSKTGLKLWFVKFDNAVFNDEGKDYYTVKTETIPINPEAHDYAFKGFTWTDGENGTATAVANFVCNNNSAHTQMPAATVEKDEAASVAPTCAAAGKNVYNASVIFEDETYTTGTEAYPAHEVTLDKVPHVYGDPTWDWTDDTHATATFTCAKCTEEADGHSVPVNATVVRSGVEGDTVAPTCTESGSYKMIATVTFEEKDYTDDRTVTDPATGHTYAPEGETPWNWTKAEEGGYTATVTVKCSKCQDLQTLNAEVEKTVEVVPTCTKAGSKTYTATATIGEGDKAQTFTDTRVDTIEAEGHIWDYASEEVTYEWDGFTKCTATVPCSKCDATTSVETTDISGEITTPATCLVNGVKTYTATFSQEGLAAATTEMLDKGDHEYGTLISGTPADCEHTGIAAHYQCSVCEKFFDEDKEELADLVIAAKGHAWGAAEYSWADDNSTVTATRSCTRKGCDKTETETVNATGEVTTVATCKDKQVTTFTSAAFSNEAFEIQTKAVEGNKNADKHVGGSTWRVEDSAESTYTTEGYDYWVCRCNGCNTVLNTETVTYNVIPHDHIYDMKVTKEATCKEEGVKTFTCQYCGDVKTETIPKSGQHGEKNSDGYCSICGADLSADARCKQCGQIHTGFFGGIVGFFHKIAYFFTHLFG